MKKWKVENWNKPIADCVLIGKVFKIYYEKGIPRVEGKIPVTGKYKSNIGYAQVDGRGKWIKVTPNGYMYDACKSGVQKWIRRGNLGIAWFHAIEMMLTGKEFISNLKNRLRVIRSEDIGSANPNSGPVARKRIAEFNYLSNLLFRKEDYQKKMMGIIKLLCKSSKSRIGDDLIHRFMEPYDGNGKIEFNTWMGKKLWRKKSGDCDELEGFMNNFIAALNERNEGAACYWFQEIFDIDPSKRSGAKRQSTRSLNGDCVYAIWEELIRRSRVNGRDTHHTRMIKALLADYDEPGKKNGRSERLYVVNAIVIECKKRELENFWWSFERCWQESKISDEEWEFIKKHEKVPLTELDCDKHTVLGRNSGKDTEYFWKVGGHLENVPVVLRNNPHAKKAMEFNMWRDKKGTPTYYRKKIVKKKKKIVKGGNGLKRITGKKRKRKKKFNDDDDNDLIPTKNKRKKLFNKMF